MVQRRLIEQIDLGWVGCGLTLLLMIPFKGPELLQGIQEQGAISQGARQAARDSAIAEQRFSNGCNTGFLVQGLPNLASGEIAVDALSGQAIAPGAILCDRSGATGVVGQDGRVRDIRVSAKVRKTYLEQGLGVK